MPVDFTVEDGIALVTINRPERLNALDAEHYRLLSQAWERVRDDSAVRVAIVTGAGERAFTVGADLKSYVPTATDIAETWLTQREQLLNRGLEVWKPVVAAVNGACLGGGSTLLFATDIRVAVPHATFNLAEVSRGLVPGNGGTQRILKQVPYAIAMEMLLTASTFDAETALRWGLVNKVVSPDRLLETAFAYARTIAANAPLAVQAAKELAIRSEDMSLATGLRMEQIANRLLWTTEDVREGPAAFAERRPPQFKGR